MLRDEFSAMVRFTPALGGHSVVALSRSVYVSTAAEVVRF